MEEKVFKASLSQLDDGMDFLREKMESMNMCMKASLQLAIAFEEMFVNVAHYAYPKGGPEGDVTVQVVDAGDRIKVRLIDSGKPFNPLKREDPDITLPAENREIGGLGIYMVKKTMDDVGYEYRDGKNIFTMTKKKE